LETPYAQTISSERARAHTVRVHAVSLVGPVTASLGVIWGILQPYRVTLLHPRGQSFWWLAVEPPLLVVLVGVLFAVFVARPLVADLEEADAAAR
jgi:hypothetical protein